MKSILASLATFALVAAKTERYIIAYDDFSWNTLSLKYLPTNTHHIFKELQMQVADLDLAEINEFSNIPGVTLHKDAKGEYFADRPSFVENNPPNWGIDRIDQKSLPLDNQYHFDQFGTGVDVWLIDSGVTTEHVEFGGRVNRELNTAGDDNDDDCVGHGSHVASSIGGFTVGVAKSARIHSIRLSNCTTDFTASNVIAGINHVIQEHKKVPGRKSVISMSIGVKTEETTVLNLAVEAAFKAGVVSVVSAGNSAADACGQSPASAPSAITVAASSIDDEHASFSNFGKCVDLYAPGVKILGADNHDTKGFNLKSGTSMATPHVTGAVALALEKGVAPADLKKYLTENGVKGVLKNVPANTPNVLLNVWKQ